MELTIVSKTESDYTAILAYLYGLGYYYDEKTSYEYLIETYPFAAYRKVYVEIGRKSSLDIVSGDYGTNINWPSQATKLFKLMSGIHSISVEISDDYTAIIKPDCIVVGYLTVSYDTFDEIVAAVEKIRK
jgi:hypothetical protein